MPCRPQLNFLGYNVYRDGQLLNDAPVKDEAFNDPTAVNNESYTYLVTALYDKGESVPSAPAEPQSSFCFLENPPSLEAQLKLTSIWSPECGSQLL